jgi:hypothetical protein
MDLMRRRHIAKPRQDGGFDVQISGGTDGGAMEGGQEPPEPERTKVIVSPDLPHEKYVPIEQTYSPEQLAAMKRGVDGLEAELGAEASKWRAKFERLDSERAQGGDVPEDEFLKVDEYSSLYATLKGAFNRGGASTPEKIGNVIDHFQGLKKSASPIDRAKMEETIERLRDLLAG